MSDPNLPVTTPKADATNRAARTIVQGVATDVALAVATGIVTAMGAADFSWSKASLSVLGLALLKTAIMAGAAYVMRLKVPPPAPEV